MALDDKGLDALIGNAEMTDEGRLFDALEAGRAEDVRLLVQAGSVSADAKDGGGETAAMYAALSGSTDCLQVLIAAKANLNEVNQWGHTAAMKAADGGHDGALALLVEARADLDITDQSGQTALDKAKGCERRGPAEFQERTGEKCVRMLEALAAETSSRRVTGQLPTPGNDAEQLDVSLSDARLTRPRTGQLAPKRAANPKREAEIAEIFAAPVPPAEVRAHLERTDFGRVPPYMREILEDLEGEEQYIISLPDERDEPKRVVRLLAAEERDLLLRGLEQQLQQATAAYLQAGPKSRKRDELEADLERIKTDIESISRPYIFVEAST